MGKNALSIAIVLPTYKRPKELSRCLEGIMSQTRRPEELVVVIRGDEDIEGERVAARFSAKSALVRTVHVDEPGLVAALRIGVSATSAAVVAVTDDDAVPRADWLAQLAGHYAPDVGGVGGRDALLTETARAKTVGSVTWWGAQIGNHHIGVGKPREVDVLKGVNMSLRRHLWVFPQALKGRGSQVHSELHLCLRARSLGWRLIYDPAIIVDHYPAQRPHGDHRVARIPNDVEAAAYNQSLALLTYASTGVQFTCRSAYRILLGDKGSPGVGRAAYGFLRRDLVWRDVGPSLRGVYDALRAARHYRACSSGLP